jgi:hypothetical protein
MRFCLLCLRPLPRRRWWQLFTPAPLCPTRDADACMAAQTRVSISADYRPHVIDAEWDPEIGQWRHHCVRCDARTTGDMPVLPCKAVNP